MSINLGMNLVVGVNDFIESDPRLVKSARDSIYVSAQEIHAFGIACNLGLIEARSMGEQVAISDVLYYPSEHTGTNLFGVRVARLSYESYDVAVAAASIFSDLSEDGYREVGVRMDSYSIKHRPSNLTESQLYRYGLTTDFSSWLIGAQFYFAACGFTVANDDLRLFLEWHWV